MSWTALHPELLYVRREAWREGAMTSVATIGLDIAKSVFQVHGVDAAGQVVVRRRLIRGRVLAFFEKLASRV
jgi:transposase